MKVFQSSRQNCSRNCTSSKNFDYPKLYSTMFVTFRLSCWGFLDSVKVCRSIYCFGYCIKWNVNHVCHITASCKTTTCTVVFLLFSIFIYKTTSMIIMFNRSEWIAFGCNAPNTVPWGIPQFISFQFITITICYLIITIDIDIIFLFYAFIVNKIAHVLLLLAFSVNMPYGYNLSLLWPMH